MTRDRCIKALGLWRVVGLPSWPWPSFPRGLQPSAPEDAQLGRGHTKGYLGTGYSLLLGCPPSTTSISWALSWVIVIPIEWVRRQLALRKCSLRSCGLWGPNTRRSYSPKHFLTFLTTFAAGLFPLPFSTKLYFWQPSQYHTVLKMSFPVDFGCGFMSVGETWLSGGQMLKSTWSTLTENY